MKLFLLKFRVSSLAADCIQFKNQRNKLTAEELVVILGRYNLEALTERGATTRDVKLIHVYPDWNTSPHKWDANVAVLLLSEAVLFTAFIQPVCLPDNESMPDTHDDAGAVSQIDLVTLNMTFHL